MLNIGEHCLRLRIDKSYCFFFLSQLQLCRFADQYLSVWKVSSPLTLCPIGRVAIGSSLTLHPLCLVVVTASLGGTCLFQCKDSHQSSHLQHSENENHLAVVSFPAEKRPIFDAENKNGNKNESDLGVRGRYFAQLLKFVVNFVEGQFLFQFIMFLTGLGQFCRLSLELERRYQQ